MVPTRRTLSSHMTVVGRCNPNNPCRPSPIPTITLPWNLLVTHPNLLRISNAHRMRCPQNSEMSIIVFMRPMQMERVETVEVNIDLSHH